VLADEGDAMTSIDWRQVEPVVAATLCRDTRPLAGYADGSSDLYTDVAAFAGVTRRAAKVVVLAWLYGQGRATLAASLGCDVERADAVRARVADAMPRTSRLVAALRATAKRHRVVPTRSGRVLPVPMGRGFDGGPPSVATHKGPNYFVQGSAYDVLADTLGRVEAAGLGDAVYLAVHDELVVSTSAAHDVRRIMEAPPERLARLSGVVPVLRTDRADLGERWAAT